METSRIFGVAFSNISSSKLIGETLAGNPSSLRYVVTCNVDHLRLLQDNQPFRAAYEAAWAVTIDGAPIAAFARLKKISAPDRMTGADLTVEIMDALDPQRHRPFFVPSSEEVGKLLTASLIARGFRPEDVSYASPAFGFERDAAGTSELIARIHAHRPTHVFMGVGAPKSEIWLHEHAAELPGCYAFCFGAGLDFAAGVKRRAPVVLQKIGMEWLWRAASEPRRLARRYLTNILFLGKLVLNERRH